MKYDLLLLKILDQVRQFSADRIKKYNCIMKVSSWKGEIPVEGNMAADLFA